MSLRGYDLIQTLFLLTSMQSVEEGAAKTIEIYLQVLNQLYNTHGFQFYIHPVVPVLNETRPIVTKFNRILKQKCLSNSRFIWMEFFEKLLDETQTQLKPKYELDGTHLHPSYVGLIQECLNCWN